MRIRVACVFLLMVCLFAQIGIGDDVGELVLDNGDATVCSLESKTGPWLVKEGEGIGGGIVYVLSDAKSIPATAKATWKLPVKGKGIWKVYIHWTADADRYGYVSYTVLNHELWSPGKGLEYPGIEPPLVEIIPMWNAETGLHGVNGTSFWIDQRYYQKETGQWLKQEGNEAVNSGWFSLGTYEFDEAKLPVVILTSSQEGWATRGRVIVADAVKIVPAKAS